MPRKISSCLQGQGPNWIFLHGWGMHQGIWSPVLPKLVETFRVRTIDLPGFGNSTWESHWQNFEQAVEVLETELLALEGKQPVRLLGWSMGGLFATALAARGKLNCHGLVLVASSPKFVQAEHWPGIQPAILANFQAQLEKDYQRTIERFLAVQAMGSPQVKQDIKRMQELLATGNPPHPEALIAGLKWLQQIDLRAEFETLSLPSLRLYGRLDSLVPVQQGEAIQKTQDSAVVFQKSAHTPFLNEAEAFAAQLTLFEKGLNS